MTGRQRERLHQRVASMAWKLEDLARQMEAADMAIPGLNVRNAQRYLVELRDGVLAPGQRATKASGG